MNEEYKYYAYDYKGTRVDPYRVMYLYGITHPAHQHALKKLMRAGNGHKDLHKDIQEVIDTLKRWQEMLGEDELQELDREALAHLQQG